MTIARRSFALASLLALAAGCSSKDDTTETPPPVDAGPDVPPEWDRPVTPPTDEEAVTKRAACAYAAGSLPAETQGKSHPMGGDIPLDTILVVMMENRSFDHYFQKLPESGQKDAEVAPAGFTNPDKDGKPVAPHRDDQWCFLDTGHGWNASHKQWNGGKMDGFVTSNDQPPSALPPHGTTDMLSGARAMTYYDPADLPLMFWLANEYAIGDRYFCSVLGPTWPNRMYLYAATSFGRASNDLPKVKVDSTLFERLETRGVRWKIYSPITPGAAMFPGQIIKYADHVVSGDDYFADAAAGTLPQFAFVDPHFKTPEAWDGDTEHPPSVMQFGQAWLAKVIDALQKSPQWKRSALFLTYDEHGGLYDHVAPPPACPPDDLEPILDPGDLPGKFDRLGFRVPFAVVSPFAKKHFVGHRVYDHTSILRFIEARFTLPALTRRDANAEAPWEMFDFAAPPHATAPTTMPAVTVDAAKQAACKAIWTR